MQATAIARPNIALIKYWGKRDVVHNLPAVGSISITLRDLFTEMSVKLEEDLAHDQLIVNSEPNSAMLGRLSNCLDNSLGKARPRASIVSQSNFPIAAGLASSASAFAALTVAACAASDRKLDRELDRTELARLAGRASGSAARSLFSGFVELENSDDRINVCSLAAADEWPLVVVVAITDTGSKKVGSTEAMEVSRRTSPFYSSWVEQQDDDLNVARTAIADRDFAGLAAISEHSCLKMHSVMWASRPPMVYWNSATMACMQTVRSLQALGHGVFFTIDAGPQVKAVCLPESAAAVAESLAATDGVKQIMTTGLGNGAALEASQ